MSLNKPSGKAGRYATRGPWRLVMAAAVAGAMALGPVVGALAATPTAGTYGTGSITIENVEGNETAFKGHQILKANVRDDASSDTGKVEASLAWASDDVKMAVVAFIKSKDADYKGEDDPQVAADWLQQHIAGTDATTILESGTVGDDLAHALDAVEGATTVQPGSKTDLAEGWWLFTTAQDTLGGYEVGTAPILAVVGGSDVTVKEKTAPITLEKEIKSDADGTWGKVADSERNQTYDYKLVGTLPGDIATFDTYQYKFVDSHSAGIDVDLGSVKVKVYSNSTEAASDLNGDKEGVGVDVTDKMGTKTLDEATKTLTVGTTDLKKVATVTKDSVVVVYYQGKLNADAVIGSTGNPNEVHIVHSNNPYTEGTGETEHKITHDYAYRLLLNKVDRNTEARLQGAKVTIQATGADDGVSKDKYVQADGSLGDEAYEFETGEDGTVSVTGLDAGTYTVTETSAPAGYDTMDPFTFTIEPTYGGDDGQTLTALATTVSGKAGDVIAGVSDGVTGDNALAAAEDAKAADKDTGTVQVTMGDVKRVSLPLTGSQAAVVVIALGAGVAAVGVTMAARRNKDDGSEA